MLLTILLCLGQLTQESGTRQSAQDALMVPAHVVDAHRWAFDTYPELKDHRMTIQVDGDTRSQRIEIDEPVGNQLAQVRQRSPLLVIEAHFTQVGALEFLSARGPAVSTPKLEALRARIASRANWTEAEVDAEIRAAGGTFGPLARVALLERAQRLSDTRKENAPIVWTAFERTESHGPVWVVDVQGARRVHRAIFEPFTGQLIAVYPR
jgi:hypothetical protein